MALVRQALRELAHLESPGLRRLVAVGQEPVPAWRVHRNPGVTPKPRWQPSGKRRASLNDSFRSHECHKGVYWSSSRFGVFVWRITEVVRVHRVHRVHRVRVAFPLGFQERPSAG